MSPFCASVRPSVIYTSLTDHRSSVCDMQEAFRTRISDFNIMCVRACGNKRHA
jgi:hypothetical protein